MVEMENGVVIPDEVLQAISGGEFDEATKKGLQVFVTLLKLSGMSLEEVVASVDTQLIDAEPDEIYRYICEYYGA